MREGGYSRVARSLQNDEHHSLLFSAVVLLKVRNLSQSWIGCALLFDDTSLYTAHLEREGRGMVRKSGRSRVQHQRRDWVKEKGYFWTSKKDVGNWRMRQSRPNFKLTSLPVVPHEQQIIQSLRLHPSTSYDLCSSSYFSSNSFRCFHLSKPRFLPTPKLLAHPLLPNLSRNLQAISWPNVGLYLS